MKLRAPSVPLVTVDPYFSVWSPYDRLTDGDPVHWTGKPNSVRGTVNVDGKTFRFLGSGSAPAMEQIGLDISALSTEYVFCGAGILLHVNFTALFLPNDLAVFTRPVGMVFVSWTSDDGLDHDVSVTLTASEELCLDCANEDEVSVEAIEHNGIISVKMGSVSQPVLEKAGDDVRINWGYFYLSSDGGESHIFTENLMTNVGISRKISPEGTLFTLAYDDIESMVYFGEHLRSFWNRSGADILSEIEATFRDRDFLFARCNEFDSKLWDDAEKCGGEKYAELLSLAYRQVCAAHKLCLDSDGSLLYISKECFSNGCAATVDVSYPSIPMFLLYNPELVEGMMRPIFKYARSSDWVFDFAPHDAGCYPHVNGQVYCDNRLEGQMPVEECGNMLIMAANLSLAEGNVSFAEENLDLLVAWEKYLERYGRDPEHQLCTDDFAGHLAHNCNLSVKAIMGVAALGIIYELLGRKDEAAEKMLLAREMAADFCVRASNGDGSLRLAYDREGTFSMKYNAVWDKLWGTGFFDPRIISSELESYSAHVNRYGLPLDNRADYTKSDWLVWTATLLDSEADFEKAIEPLWLAYNESESRVPLTDWYDTKTAKMVGFQHRTVQGGLFIRLLSSTGKLWRRA